MALNQPILIRVKSLNFLVTLLTLFKYTTFAALSVIGSLPPVAADDRLDTCTAPTIDEAQNITIPCLNMAEGPYYQLQLLYDSEQWIWEYGSHKPSTCEVGNANNCAQLLEGLDLKIPHVELEGEPTTLLKFDGHDSCSLQWRLEHLPDRGDSDKRWKKNVQPLQNTLEKLSQLQGVSFQWDIENYPDVGFDDTPQIGLIAQEVEQVFPELVTTNNEGYKGVKYNKLTAILIEAVKELKAQNDALKTIVCKESPEEEICQ